MFDESNSLSSTNLPDKIWLTNFGGMGKSLGPPQTTAAKQVHLAKRKTWWEAARPQHSKAKERQKAPAAKKLACSRLSVVGDERKRARKKRED